MYEQATKGFFGGVANSGPPTMGPACVLDRLAFLEKRTEALEAALAEYSTEVRNHLAILAQSLGVALPPGQPTSYGG